MLALRACIGGADAQLQQAGELLGITQERVRQIQAKAVEKLQPSLVRVRYRKAGTSGDIHPSRPAMESDHDIEWGRPLDENIVASQRELLCSWKSQFDRLAMPQYSCRKMFLSNSLKTTGKFNDRKIDVQCPQLPHQLPHGPVLGSRRRPSRSDDGMCGDDVTHPLGGQRRGDPCIVAPRRDGLVGLPTGG